MTREEKEQTGKYVLQMARLLEDGCYQQEMLLKAVHIIDEALEQEPVIDKIRERVELEKRGYPPSAGYYKAIMKVLQFIDEYKEESEG